MAFLFREKNWIFQVNEIVGADANAYILAFKNMLKNFGWTVKGSSNSVAAGMDGIDRWATVANIVWNAAGAHSWIVLRNPALNGAEFLIDCNDTFFSADVDPDRGMSPSGAFIGGSITARPTAIDEVICPAGDVIRHATSSQIRLHSLQSQDGKHTYSFATNLFSTERLRSIFVFGQLEDTHAAWTPNCICAWDGDDSTGVTIINRFTSSALVAARILGEPVLAWPSYEHKVDGRFVADFFNAPNDLTNEWPHQPVGLVSNTVNRKAKLGRFVDLWFGAPACTPGTTFPSDASRQFAHIGGIVIPWNGTVPVMS